MFLPLFKKLLQYFLKRLQLQRPLRKSKMLV